MKYIGATVGFGIEVEVIEGEDSNKTASRILDEARKVLGSGHDPFIVQIDDEEEEWNDD